MSRRNSIIYDVMQLPWPVGVVFAIIVYVGLQIFHGMAPQGLMGQAILPAISMLAYFFMVLLLLGSFFSFLRQARRARRFDKTHSLSDIRGLSWRQFESFTAEAYRFS